MSAVDWHEKRLSSARVKLDGELLEHARVQRVIHPADDHGDQVRPMADHDARDDAWPIAELLPGGEHLFPGPLRDAGARPVASRDRGLRDPGKPGDVG